MKTLADFKRAAQPGSVWQCVNHLHPHVSGERRIMRGKSVLRYEGTKADGSTFGNGRQEFPKSELVKFEGNSVHFLDERDGASIKYTWTLVQEGR